MVGKRDLFTHTMVFLVTPTARVHSPLSSSPLNPPFSPFTPDQRPFSDSYPPTSPPSPPELSVPTPTTSTPPTILPDRFRTVTSTGETHPVFPVLLSWR